MEARQGGMCDKLKRYFREGSLKRANSDTWMKKRKKVFDRITILHGAAYCCDSKQPTEPLLETEVSIRYCRRRFSFYISWHLCWCRMKPEIWPIDLFCVDESDMPLRVDARSRLQFADV